MASAKFAKITVNHSQKAMARSKAMGPPLRLGHQWRDDERHDLDHEHDRVPPQRPGVSFRKASSDARFTIGGSNRGLALTAPSCSDV